MGATVNDYPDVKTDYSAHSKNRLPNTKTLLFS
jgi:hypothetical protein